MNCPSASSSDIYLNLATRPIEHKNKERYVDRQDIRHIHTFLKFRLILRPIGGFVP